MTTMLFILTSVSLWQPEVALQGFRHLGALGDAGAVQQRRDRHAGPVDDAFANGQSSYTNGTRTDGAANVNIWLPNHNMHVSPTETIDTMNSELNVRIGLRFSF